MPDIDLNLLAAFDALLAEGSVMGAARRLGLSASAMSRALARLRAATADPLLVRAGRAMVPTPHALELRERVHAIAADALAVLSPRAARLDLASLSRTFVVRANDAFVEVFGARLITEFLARAPHARLHFALKTDKDVRSLREGLADLEIGVIGEAGPEIRVQALFRDQFVGVVRSGHPLVAGGKVTAQAYASCGHVVASRRGRARGPIDDVLAGVGLERKVVAIVPSFSAAVAVAAETDLVALVTRSFMVGYKDRPTSVLTSRVQSFRLPLATDPIVVSQGWHPQHDAEVAHRWLRGIVLMTCREKNHSSAGQRPKKNQTGAAPRP